MTGDGSKNMYLSNRDRSTGDINSVNMPRSRYKSHNRFEASSVDNAKDADRHRITTNTFMSRTTSRDMHRPNYNNGDKKNKLVNKSSLSRDYNMNKTKGTFQTDHAKQNANSARKYEGNSKSIDIHGLVKIKGQLKSRSKNKLKGEKSVNVDVNDVALENTFGSIKNSKKSGDIKSTKNSNIKNKANQSQKSKNSIKNNSFMSKKSNTKLSDKNFSDKFDDEDYEGEDDFEDSKNVTKKQNTFKSQKSTKKSNQDLSKKSNQNTSKKSNQSLNKKETQKPDEFEEEDEFGVDSNSKGEVNKEPFNKNGTNSDLQKTNDKNSKKNLNRDSQEDAITNDLTKGSKNS